MNQKSYKEFQEEYIKNGGVISQYEEAWDTHKPYEGPLTPTSTAIYDKKGNRVYKNLNKSTLFPEDPTMRDYGD